MHDAGFEDERAEREKKSGRRVLEAQGRTPIDAAAEALLIKRADGDAEKRRHDRRPGQRRGRAGGILPHHQIDAEEAEQQAKPLPRQHAFAEPAVGKGRGQHRLQADDQRGEPGGKAVFDGDKNTAEIEAVHHEAGHHAVHHAGAARPFWPRDQHDEDHEPHHRDHAQRQESQRLGIAQPELCADEAGRPEQDKNTRCRKDGEFLKRTRHRSGGPL